MSAPLADYQVSVASKQYLPVPFSFTLGGDPTTDTVQMAFPSSGSDPSVYYTASWTTVSGVYYAKCLIGPSGTAVLPAGFYDVYVKVAAGSETPVQYSGVLEVF